jgi:hypothetical protein
MKYAQYHQVLNLAVWNPLGLAQVRQLLLVRAFYGQDEPLVSGIDATICLLCTDQTVTTTQIINWFVRRWQVKVAFEEARRHLGIETQRQWSGKAIARTTPLLLGLFSWVTLVAHAFHSSGQPIIVRQSAWYTKSLPTFSDALALVRCQLWTAFPTFQTSHLPSERIKGSRPFFVSLIETLCYAA